MRYMSEIYGVVWYHCITHTLVGHAPSVQPSLVHHLQAPPQILPVSILNEFNRSQWCLPFFCDLIQPSIRYCDGQPDYPILSF